MPQRFTMNTLAFIGSAPYRDGALGNVRSLPPQCSLLRVATRRRISTGPLRADHGWYRTTSSLSSATLSLCNLGTLPSLPNAKLFISRCNWTLLTLRAFLSMLRLPDAGKGPGQRSERMLAK
jgi:hypothetical protein